ncbi:protein neprosin-like [Vicia villosa]|uniref:protein neprosin-like n=1 Tax=Vicia villosa TaxID=3911 RepID=UPI00273B2F5F|nr:protein neprosin-like [Vicia villosa]
MDAAVENVVPLNKSCEAFYETGNHQSANQTFKSEQKLYKLKKIIASRLQQINKPAIKTIQSPDGDIIDCVLTHKQPAFDHPLLKGEKPMDPPESLRRHNKIENTSDHFQLWSLSGESCPEGSIPIRRITEEDMLRAYSIKGFGRKFDDPYLHEYAVVTKKNDKFYGAEGAINVWTPYIETPNEFSLAQMWLIAGSYGKDLNTIEIGWQVYPHLYGDYRTRFFIYWTGDDYKSTGCYNLICPGFVQTNKRFAIGGAINKISTYNGRQYSMTLKIFKDKNTGNWWLQVGPGSGNLVGYWPSKLFTHLKFAAEEVNFGGEIVNIKSTGSHTSTVMGSGNFPEEGFRKAAYIRNMQVIDADNNLHPLKNPEYSLTNFFCYSIVQGNTNPKWGYHIYFGGYGRGNKCP